jgi:hypothetical protein
VGDEAERVKEKERRGEKGGELLGERRVVFY